MEFSYEDPYDNNKNLTGFRLFKEGKKICESNDPDKRTIECNFQSAYGIFEFTLAPVFSDGSLGPHSSSYTADFSKESSGDSDKVSTTIQNIIRLLVYKE